MNKNEWKIVEECNDDDNKPTCWAKRLNEDLGYGKFIWIDKINDNCYDVICDMTYNVLKTCKSLASAKRWVSVNIK